MSEKVGKALNSCILFIMPSFGKGMARGISIFGELDEYNYSKSGKEADSRALERDWKLVGQDLRSTMDSYDQRSHKFIQQ